MLSPPDLRTRRRSGTRMETVSNIGAAVLFIVGCIGFYSPSLHRAATTAFLLGSVLFLVSAIVGRGPTRSEQ
jgi:YrhK-like protein